MKLYQRIQSFLVRLGNSILHRLHRWIPIREMLRDPLRRQIRIDNSVSDAHPQMRHYLYRD